MGRKKGVKNKQLESEDKPVIPVYVNREGYAFCEQHRTYYHAKKCPLCQEINWRVIVKKQINEIKVGEHETRKRNYQKSMGGEKLSDAS